MGPAAEDDRDVLQRRLERERRARRQAEAVAERATGELYASVAKLEQLNRELEDANQAIKEFVAIASHDLGSPLTAMLGFAEILRLPDQSDEDRRTALEAIVRSGGRMKRLVEDLLILSRLEAGAVQPRPVEFAVAEEMKGSLAQLGEEGRSIVVQATPDLVVRADRDHFQRIFANYATNAVKYGGPPIVAEASRIPSFVEVCVKDQGPGVPEIFVNRLFSKFARAETEATRSSEGTGLGLSIVRGLAQANGGDTWYEPNSPSGSCFGVRLPSGG